jgi:hypothetical protein
LWAVISSSSRPSPARDSGAATSSVRRWRRSSDHCVQSVMLPFRSWTAQSMDLGFKAAHSKLAFSKVHTLTMGKWSPNNKRGAGGRRLLSGSDTRVGNWAMTLTSLTELNIVSSNVGWDHLLALTRDGPHHLSVLRLQDCPAVDDGALKLLLDKHRPFLTVLHVHNCHRLLSDESLRLVEKCRELREFSVVGHRKVSVLRLRMVKVRCTKLREFRVFKCAHCNCEDMYFCNCFPWCEKWTLNV